MPAGRSVSPSHTPTCKPAVCLSFPSPLAVPLLILRTHSHWVPGNGWCNFVTKPPESLCVRFTLLCPSVVSFALGLVTEGLTKPGWPGTLQGSWSLRELFLPGACGPAVLREMGCACSTSHTCLPRVTATMVAMMMVMRVIMVCTSSRTGSLHLACPTLPPFSPS